MVKLETSSRTGQWVSLTVRIPLELATAEYRAGQLAASLQHAVAAAEAAEPARRPDLLADAALVVRGIGHHQVAVTLLGLCDRALADPECPAARRARLLAQRASVARGRRLAVRIQDVSGAGMSYAFALSMATIRGDPTELQPDFFEVLADAPPIPVIRASQAAALFATGRNDEVRAVYETLRQLPAAGDRDVRTLGSLNQLIDLIIAYRDTDTAQATYDLFHPFAAHGGTFGSGLVSLYGSVQWPLGGLAALLGRTEQALDHFASALAVNTRLGAGPFVVVTRLDWATTLAGRAVGDDLTQARELAMQAAGEARRLDMPGPTGRAERLAGELKLAIGTANPLTPGVTFARLGLSGWGFPGGC